MTKEKGSMVAAGKAVHLNIPNGDVYIGEVSRPAEITSFRGAWGGPAAVSAPL